MDERGLAYAAVGFARATGRPGVVICTSGTAVSNLTPAVVEASMSGCPLLLLTADRPFELRDCGANQSIPQTNAFDPYIVFSRDLPAPERLLSPRVVVSTVDAAFQQVWRGPVHLNCPFREPLASVDPEWDAEAYLEPVQDWRDQGGQHTQFQPPVFEADPLVLGELKELFASSPDVLVIAGGGCTEAEAMAIHQLAAQQDWPLVSDVTSGLHFGPGCGDVVRHVDEVLASSRFPEALRPRHVLQFGTRFLSKVLLKSLEAESPDSWVVVTPREGNYDPAHRVTHRLQAGIDRFCLAWHQEPMVPTRPEWREGWLRAERRVEEVYGQQLDEAHTLTEPGIARAVTRQIPALHGLVLGASMPIRDVNRFSFPNPHRVHVAANRGASGIDGTLATAVGFAKGLVQPVTVLLGDLAALHDLNSLSLLAKSQVPVIVIIINNDGGGIFHFLPVPESDPAFDQFFATAHGWSFELAAAMFDLPYERPADLTAFSQTYRRALQTSTSCVLEVCTDRKRNVEQHQALTAMLDLPA
jgi:2-succinyl-5-enolpyruvyl-6-hydroxy-3-cyclohexene-1-carboxylate synthase